MSLGFYSYGECKLNKDSLYIKYYITNKCNFSCDYCYRKEFSYRDEEPSYNDIDTMIEHLQGNNIDTFCFIGGEPSISDKIFYSIDKVFEHLYCKNVIIYSNAYNVSFFQKLKELYFEKNISLFLTYHPKYADKVFYNYEIIYNLFPNNTAIRCMLDMRYIDNINRFFDYYNNYNITTGFIFDSFKEKSILNCIKNKYFNKDLLSSINKDYTLFSLINDNLLVKYYGSLCYNNCIDIFPNGNMKYESCCNEQLDNIYMNHYTHKPSYIQCNNKYIYCNYMCNHRYHEKNGDVYEE